MNLPLGLGLGLFITLTSSSALSQSSSSLALTIKAEQIEEGMPQAFTFQLTNRSDHELRVPKPIVNCGGNYTGSLALQVRFVPFTSGDALPGHGCAADKYKWPPILERIKAWRILHPRESLTITGDKTQLFLDHLIPGSYEFWAVYKPPFVSAEEQKTLQSARIDFPQAELVSDHVTFIRKAP